MSEPLAGGAPGPCASSVGVAGSAKRRARAPVAADQRCSAPAASTEATSAPPGSAARPTTPAAWPQYCAPARAPRTLSQHYGKTTRMLVFADCRVQRAVRFHHCHRLRRVHTHNGYFSRGIALHIPLRLWLWLTRMLWVSWSAHARVPGRPAVDVARSQTRSTSAPGRAPAAPRPTLTAAASPGSTARPAMPSRCARQECTAAARSRHGRSPGAQALCEKQRPV